MEGTLTWLRQLMPPATTQSPEWLQTAYRVAVNQMARAAHAAPNAARLVEETAGDPCFTPDMAVRVGSRYAWSGANAALDWADRVSAKQKGNASQVRMQIVSGVLSQTMDHDAANASKWCAERLQGPDREQAKALLVQRMAAKPELLSQVNQAFAAKP